MYNTQTLNRQLFLFIISFSIFAYVISHTIELPPVLSMVFGAPSDEWTILEELAVFEEPWDKESGTYTVTREEAARLFFAVEGFDGGYEGYRSDLLGEGVLAVDTNGALQREELVRLLARVVDETDSPMGEKYFERKDDGSLPLDTLARLGIVDLPFDRTFVPDEPVTRQEVALAAARILEPKLRAHNAPTVVQTQEGYTYAMMEADILRLAQAYPELITLQVIGESVEGRKLYAARLGHGEREIILDAAIHGTEWLTTPLLLKMLEEYAWHARYGTEKGGYHVASLLEEVSLWFIPMVNPDGVTLVLEGLAAVENGVLVRKIASANNGASNFRDWKANIHGVDLNRNFPSRWHQVVSGNHAPAPAFFKGSTPLSEPESKALYDFTLERRPTLVISYHQRGEVIFWYTYQQGAQLKRDERIVRGLGNLTGYKWGYPGTDGGKYRDWVIQELGATAVIIETGKKIGNISEWNRIWQQNRYVGLEAARLILEEGSK
jgi:hypothetical protein